MTDTPILDWLAGELRPLCAPPPPGGPSHAAEVWCGDELDHHPDDHGPSGRVEAAAGFRLGAARAVYRHLCRRGWSEVSLKIYREDADG